MSLRAEHVGLVRGGKRLVDGVDLEICPGEMVAVIGPNGAGKTSLLRLLSGELACDSGRVLLDGERLAAVSLAERARRLAVLPQQSMLEFPFLAEEVVAMGLTPWGSSQQAGVVAEVMAMLGCRSLAGRVYTTLSGGERQRVQLARVLAQVWTTPGYLLLDEPTAPLDLAHQLVVLSALRTMSSRGAAVLLVMHDINLAARFVDRLLLLSRGTATALGTPAEVIASDLVGQAFGVSVERLLTAAGVPQLVAHPGPGTDE